MNIGAPDYKPLPHIPWTLLEGSYNRGSLIFTFESSYFECDQLQVRKVLVDCRAENWRSSGILVNAHVSNWSISDPYDTSSFIYTTESVMDEYLLLFDGAVTRSHPVGPIQGYPPGSTKTETLGYHSLTKRIQIGRAEQNVGGITLLGHFTEATGTKFAVKWTKD